MEEKKKFDKIIPIILGVVIILIIGLIVKQVIDFNSNSIDNNTDDGNNTEENNYNEQTSKKELEIYLCTYKSGNSNYIYDKNKLSFCEDYEIAVKLEVTDSNAKILAEKESYYLFRNQGLYIYDIKDNKTYKLALEDEYEKYDLIVDKNKKLIGIFGKSNPTEAFYNSGYENTIFYNFKTKKSMYKNKFHAIMGDNKDYLGGSILGKTEEESKSYIFKTDEEKIVLSLDGNYYIEIKSYNNKNYYLVSKMSSPYGGQVTIYDNNMNIIVKDLPTNAANTNTKYSFDINGYLYIKENNTISKYDYNGKLINKIDKYKDIRDLILNYVVYVENNKLMIADINGNYKKEIIEWDNKKYYHSMISGYYKSSDLESTNEKNKRTGIYLIIELDGNKEGPGVEYYINIDTGEMEHWDLEYVGGYAKPVLYLYPKQITDVTVNFEKESLLTTTYPKFNKEWKVKAYPNGDLYDSNNKYYYGLYWEEDKNHTISFNEGFYVTSKNAINFLEEKLTFIGLNDRERNEFIMYWLPILEKNEQSLVYFELTEERDFYNKLLINPQPDSLLRIAIHIKKVDHYIDIKEQKLKPFKRVGFTAVEWGGVQY